MVRMVSGRRKGVGLRGMMGVGGSGRRMSESIETSRLTMRM